MTASYRILHQSGSRIRLGLPFVSSPNVQNYLNQLARQVDEIDYLQFYLQADRMTIHIKPGQKIDLASFLSRIDLDTVQSFYEDAKDLVTEGPGQIITSQVLKRMTYKTLVPPPVRYGITLAKACTYGWQALQSLLAKQLDMAVLDFAAVLASIYQNDYEAAGTIMFILELGERLDAWTLDKSISDLTAGLNQSDVDIWRLDEDDERHLVNAQLIKAGDRIVVAEGQSIYFDGQIVAGSGATQEGSLTGEPFPVAKQVGDQVYANTVLESGELIVQVTDAQMNSRLHRLIDQIHTAQDQQSSQEVKLLSRADDLVKYNFIGMALTYLLTGQVAKAMTFLMVDFSCAIKLSTSISYMTAIRQALQAGILVKGSRFIDLYQEIDQFIFDKTGTLTESKLEIKEVIPFGDYTYEEVLRIAACLEEHFYHPIAQSVVDKAKDEGIDHEEMHGPLYHIASKGVKSSIDGQPVLIGSYRFLHEEGVVFDQDSQALIDKYKGRYNLLYLSFAKDLIAIFCIDTPLRAETVSVLSELKAQGKELALLTGDTSDRTAAVRELVDFDQVKTDVSPQDKFDFIKAQQADNKKVLMIGDGLNDSAAIAQADIGVVMADSSDIARQTADIIFLNDQLTSFARMDQVHYALDGQLNRNLKLAVAINSSLIGFGLLGWLAGSSLALLHNLTTVVIVADSLKFKVTT
ncbi:hypothetical protein AWM75_02800 [Aerococcus urinaehominis]|uniref:Cd(2+)-exporting ATPase n=1 Tax=Aerococcus urinaehominis TaxID=128944 RepID=A0A0X8FKI7_9LACT|nr:heavy metal translocating P-type ATPase [Aerococcus urinaehominis]AMB98990.1 hypothetical protein AWM75_02800 [Aerococcus urinaehominis]SDM38200.1 ATPase, P-type (transporting), HAD superfamily, subfamily IC/heavy metal translocating P-type ATPase [Aerococcus urinaehominis]